MGISPSTSVRPSPSRSILAAVAVASGIPLGLAVTVALLNFVVGSGG
jgi:hypothetical protein